MIADLSTLLFSVTALVALVAALILFVQLQGFRVDIPRGSPYWAGTSPWGMLNALNHNNYEPAAKHRVMWLTLSLSALGISIGGLVCLGIIHDVRAG